MNYSISQSNLSSNFNVFTSQKEPKEIIEKPLLKNEINFALFEEKVTEVLKKYSYQTIDIAVLKYYEKKMKETLDECFAESESNRDNLNKFKPVNYKPVEQLSRRVKNVSINLLQYTLDKNVLLKSAQILSDVLKAFSFNKIRNYSIQDNLIELNFKRARKMNCSREKPFIFEIPATIRLEISDNCLLFPNADLAPRFNESSWWALSLKAHYNYLSLLCDCEPHRTELVVKELLKRLACSNF